MTLCLHPDPHPSPTSVPGMMEVLPGRCVPIAKRELLWAGSAGLACWLAGVIFIDRKRTGDAISVMSEVAQTLLPQDVSHPGDVGVLGLWNSNRSWLGESNEVQRRENSSIV